MRVGGLRGAVVAGALALGLFAEAAEAEPLAVGDPYAGVTRTDVDGLAVYAARVPGDWTVASVTIGAGQLDDPAGKEGLAHLCEHVAFTDAEGSQLAAQAVVRRAGGTSNARTTLRTTHYWIRVPAARSRLAVSWLAERLAQRAVTERQVEAERAVVAIEGGIRPAAGGVVRSVARRVGRALPNVLDFEPARPCPGELGLSEGSPTVTWGSLSRIGAEDVQRFFDTRCVREQVVVAVFGPVDPADSVAWVAEDFATLPHGAARVPLPDPRPVRSGDCVEWTDDGSARLRMAWSFTGCGGQERVTLLVLRNLLEIELNEATRFTNRSAYWLDVSVRVAEGRGSLIVSGRVDPLRAREVRADVRRTFEAFATGTVEGLDDLREPVALQFASGGATPGGLDDWVASDAWRRDDLPTFPQPVDRALRATAGDLASWIQAHAESAELDSILTVPDPVPEGVRRLLFAMPIAIIGFVLLRRVARHSRSAASSWSAPLRWGVVTTAVLAALALAVPWLVAVMLRHEMLDLLDPARAPLGRPAWLLVELVDASLLSVLILVASSVLPWRVVADDDGLVFESLGWQLGRVAWNDVSSVAVAGLGEAIAESPPWRWRLLSLALLRRGVHVRTSRGVSWFFRIDDPSALVEAWQGRVLPAPEPAEST